MNILFTGKWLVIKTEMFWGRSRLGLTSARGAVSRESEHQPSLTCSPVASCVCTVWFQSAGQNEVGNLSSGCFVLADMFAYLLLCFERNRRKGLKKTPFGSNTEWEQHVSLAGKNISCTASFKHTVVCTGHWKPPGERRGASRATGRFLRTCCSSRGWQLQREGQEGHTAINRVSRQLSSLYEEGKQDEEGPQSQLALLRFPHTIFLALELVRERGDLPEKHLKHVFRLEERRTFRPSAGNAGDGRIKIT